MGYASVKAVAASAESRRICGGTALGPAITMRATAWLRSAIFSRSPGESGSRMAAIASLSHVSFTRTPSTRIGVYCTSLPRTPGPTAPLEATTKFKIARSFIVAP